MSYAIRLKESKKVHLKEIEPNEDGGLKREEAEKKTAELGEEMGRLHDLLFAAGQSSLLLVLQGRDTSGKDGLIRHLFKYINAQSCEVVPFKVPTEEELRHDFLWRVHPHAPGRGNVAIFNRSHYEDVLVARVHHLVPDEVWKRRYDHINHFESLLADSQTIILKFCLHISKGEQEERLLERQKEPEKAWKLNVGDWKEREYWDDYTEAYEDALYHCNAKHAPWYLIPANHKWYRNLAVTQTIVETLRTHEQSWKDALTALGKQRKQEIDAYLSTASEKSPSQKKK